MHKLILIAIAAEKEIARRDEVVEDSIHGLVTLHVLRRKLNDGIGH